NGILLFDFRTMTQWFQAMCWAAPRFGALGRRSSWRLPIVAVHAVLGVFFTAGTAADQQDQRRESLDLPVLAADYRGIRPSFPCKSAHRGGHVAVAASIFLRCSSELQRSRNCT